MRILMISSYFPPYIAGAELYTYETARYFAKGGHEVHVVTKQLGGLPAYEKMEGIHVHRVRCFDLPKMRSFTAFLPMLFKSISIKFDIIHAHISYPSGIIAHILKKITGKPYIVTCQGDELMDYPESKQLRYIVPLLRKVYQNASFVHCISKALKDSLVKNFRANKRKIHIIPNGVDLVKFKQKRNNKLKRKHDADFILLNVSRLSPKNNIERTIKAFHKIPGDKIKYIIAGEGESRKKIQSLVNSLGEKRVILLGNVDHKKIPELMNGADAFIRTSITEGLGVVFLEAMAVGLPIITSNVQGILDIVKNGYNGILVNPNDEEATRKAIKRMIDDEKLRKRMDKNGREFVQKYDWDNICKETEKLYRKALKVHVKKP